MPAGLLERFKADDKELVDNSAYTGGMENPAPGQCTCERMSKVAKEDDKKNKYQCKRVQGAGKCLSPSHNMNNDHIRPTFWKCDICPRVICTRCLNSTIFLNKLRDEGEMANIKKQLHECKFQNIPPLTRLNCR